MRDAAAPAGHLHELVLVVFFALRAAVIVIAMSVPSLSENYQDILHEFMELQYLANEELDSLISHLFPADEGVDSPPDQYIRAINTVIKSYKMEIMKVRDEKTGSTNYVLVYLCDNSRSRKSSLRTAQQLAFFQLILTGILTSDDKSIPATEAVNMILDTNSATTSRKTKMSIGQAEELTEKWISCHLLDWNEERDCLVLGFVAAAEFGQFIKTHYPAAYKACSSCKLLCLRGVTCHRCSAATHVHCTGGAVSRADRSFTCVTCRSS